MRVRHGLITVALAVLAAGVPVGDAVAAPGGWDALSRLDAIAGSVGLDVDEVLEASPFVNGDAEFGFDGMVRSRDVRERADLRRDARNFGELQRAAALAEADLPADDDIEDDGAGKAELLGAAFGVDAAALLELRAAGVGFGALVHLLRLSAATGLPVTDLLAGVPVVDGEYDFSFGELKKNLTPDQLAALAELPRNLGHIVSASHRPDHVAAKAALRAEAKAEKDQLKADRKAARDEAKADRDEAKGHDDDREDEDEDEDD